MTYLLVRKTFMATIEMINGKPQFTPHGLMRHTYTLDAICVYRMRHRANAAFVYLFQFKNATIQVKPNLIVALSLNLLKTCLIYHKQGLNIL